MQKVAKNFMIAVTFGAIFIFAFWLYIKAEQEAYYFGLPPVECIDSTKPVVQDFTFHITITINGKNIPLSSNIGHDPGNCLRIIDTNDSSGTVNVVSNYSDEKFTLSDFFEVWHKQFNYDTLMGYPLGKGHNVEVYVNGEKTSTLYETVIHPNDNISVIYR